MINQIVPLELELYFLAYSLTCKLMETMVLAYSSRLLICTLISNLFFLNLHLNR